MINATFHRHLFLGVMKYSKLCESMTILAPDHLRGIQINGEILVWKCENQLTTFLRVYMPRRKHSCAYLSGSLTTEKLNKINRNDITRSSGTPSGLNISQDQKVCRRNVCRRNVLSAKRPHPDLFIIKIVSKVH